MEVRETHTEVREGSGDPYGGSGRVGTPTQRSGKGRETNLEVREWFGDKPGALGRVGRPTWSSGKDWTAHPVVWEALPDLLEGSGIPP